MRFNNIKPVFCKGIATRFSAHCDDHAPIDHETTDVSEDENATLLEHSNTPVDCGNADAAEGTNATLLECNNAPINCDNAGAPEETNATSLEHNNAPIDHGTLAQLKR